MVSHMIKLQEIPEESKMSLYKFASKLKVRLTQNRLV